MTADSSFLKRTKMSLRPGSIVFDAEYVRNVAEKYGTKNPMINWMLAKGNSQEGDGPFEAGTAAHYSLKKMGLAVGEYERGQQEPSPMDDILQLTALVNELLVGKGYFPGFPAAYFDLMRLQGSKNRFERGR